MITFLKMNKQEPKRIVGGDLYNYEFGDIKKGGLLSNQILMSSDRITINSKTNNSTISSGNNTIIGSGNQTHMVSENKTVIEASNVYLGRQAEDQTQPMVLGAALVDFLHETLDLLGRAHALVQGVPIPLTDATMAPLSPQIELLIRKLNNPLFWSEYHFIEDNGNKPE